MMQTGRPPRGGRGLKSFHLFQVKQPSTGRPPRGGRGLKSRQIAGLHTDNRSRPPRGGRGLKYNINGGSLGAITVAPLAGGVD